MKTTDIPTNPAKTYFRYQIRVMVIDPIGLAKRRRAGDYATRKFPKPTAAAALKEAKEIGWTMPYKSKREVIRQIRLLAQFPPPNLRMETLEILHY